MHQSCSCRDRDVLCRDKEIVATSFSCFSASGNYRDIDFFIATSIFTLSTYTLSQYSLCCSSATLSRQIFLMSRHNFFSYSTISIATNFSFVATNFSFMVLVVGWAVCCDIEIFVATDLTWLILVLFQFLSRPNFLLSRQNSFTLQLLLSRQKTSLSRQRFCFQFFIMLQHEVICRHSSCIALQLLIAIEISLSRQSSLQPHVLFVATEIIFIATKSCCSLL